MIHLIEGAVNFQAEKKRKRKNAVSAMVIFYFTLLPKINQKRLSLPLWESWKTTITSNANTWNFSKYQLSLLSLVNVKICLQFTHIAWQLKLLKIKGSTATDVINSIDYISNRKRYARASSCKHSLVMHAYFSLSSFSLPSFSCSTVICNPPIIKVPPIAIPLHTWTVH